MFFSGGFFPGKVSENSFRRDDQRSLKREQEERSSSFLRPRSPRIVESSRASWERCREADAGCVISVIYSKINSRNQVVRGNRTEETSSLSRGSKLRVSSPEGGKPGAGALELARSRRRLRPTKQIKGEATSEHRRAVELPRYLDPVRGLRWRLRQDQPPPRELSYVFFLQQNGSLFGGEPQHSRNETKENRGEVSQTWVTERVPVGGEEKDEAMRRSGSVKKIEEMKATSNSGRKNSAHG